MLLCLEMAVAHSAILFHAAHDYVQLVDLHFRIVDFDIEYGIKHVVEGVGCMFGGY